MKSSRSCITLLMLFTLGFCSPSSALDKSRSTGYGPYTTCIDKNLGYKVKCSPQWNLSVKPNSIVILIDEQPGQIVTATISKSEESGLTLSDLTPSTIQSYFDYADYYKLSKTRIRNKKALRIEATSALYPEIRFLDYLFVKDSHLYRISFAVNSKEHYENFEPLFEDIVDSFDFYHYHPSLYTKKRSVFQKNN